MPKPYVDRKRLTTAILNKISESIGEAIGFPDSTEVNHPSPGVIEIKVTTHVGIKYFEVRVVKSSNPHHQGDSQNVD